MAYKNVYIDSATPVYDTEYLTGTQNSVSHTYTFKKACTGVVGRNTSMTVSGSMPLTLVPDTTTTNYSDTFYRFYAQPGDTITFTRTSSWVGYEIIIDEGGSGSSGGEDVCERYDGVNFTATKDYSMIVYGGIFTSSGAASVTFSGNGTVVWQGTTSSMVNWTRYIYAINVKAGDKITAGNIQAAMTFACP